MHTTTDLADFGYRELVIASNIIRALAEKPKPVDFETESGLKIMMNKESGEVFLTNSFDQVAMINKDGVLEADYSTPSEGREGFLYELVYENDLSEFDSDDLEFLMGIAKRRDDIDAQEHIKGAMQCN